MAQRDDILIEPASPVGDANRPLGARFAAFIPITVAIVGLGMILIGGVSARHDVTAEVPAIDSIATGSIIED
jgi:hypothetical protein